MNSEDKFRSEGLRLMHEALRSDVEWLKRQGEIYPVAVVVDGVSRAARRLKRLLPKPPGHMPEDPGVFAAYPHALARACLQRVLGRGHLLDDPAGADPDGGHWNLFVLRDKLIVELVTVRGGEKRLLRRQVFSAGGWPGGTADERADARKAHRGRLHLRPARSGSVSTTLYSVEGKREKKAK
jgi:hypothetical protein